MHSTWQTRHAEEFKMNNSLSIHCKLRKSQQGSSLIEVLITMLIVAVGLLGAGGMQIASTRYQQTAFMRSQAIVQAQFIAEKIRANNAVVWNAAAPDNEKYLAPDSYAAAGTLPTDPACGMTSGSTCTGRQAAIKDLRDWRQSVAALPGGRGSIVAITSGGATDQMARTVVVMWQEKQDNEVDANAATVDTSCPVPPAVPAAAPAGVRCFAMVVAP